MPIASVAEIATYLGLAGSASESELALLGLIQSGAERALIAELGFDPAYGLRTEYLPIGRASRPLNPLADYDRFEGVGFYQSSFGGSDKLALKYCPVWLEGLSVWVDEGGYGGQEQTGSHYGSDKLLTMGRDYVLDTDHIGETDADTYGMYGTLRRLGSSWESVPQSIKVQYYGGWRSQDIRGGEASDLLHALVLAVSAEYWKAQALIKTGGTGGLTGESLGYYSYSSGGGGSSTSMRLPLPPQARQILQRFKPMAALFGR